MIGLEREHHKLEAGSEHPGDLPGVRTFALFGLAGWLGAFLGGVWPYAPIAVVLAAAGFLIRNTTPQPNQHNFTTNVAALVTVLLGMLVLENPLLSVALAVLTTLLLIAKPWVRRTVPRLRRQDLTGTLQLGVALAIVLPLLPKQASDPWGALPPQKIGLFVTLVFGVSWVGYVLSRLFDRERSAVLTGLVGGLASSTAVTAAMAQTVKTHRELARVGQLATYLACAVMSARLLVIAGIASPVLARKAFPGIGALGIVMLTGAAWSWFRVRNKPAPAEVAIENPVSLVSALKWGVFLCFVLLASALAYRWFGDRGTLLTAAIAGIADADALALAMSNEAQGVPITVAAQALVVAACVNTVVKGLIALVTGGFGYGRPMIPVFAGSILLAGAVALLL
jgi:uncharacterized membrane protein (DUF4010 family)